MPERHENDYENTSGQWEETSEGGRVTYRERRSPRQAAPQGAPRTREEYRQPSRSQAPRNGHATVPPRRPSEERRTYRADSSHAEDPRANRARAGYGSAPASAGGAAAAAQPGLLEPVLLLAVVVLAFISIISSVVSCTSSQGEEITLENTASAAAANVEAAEKTTDENGIVHGTTTDGVNFTIVTATGAQQTTTSSASSTSSSTAESSDATSDSDTTATSDSTSSSAAAVAGSSTTAATTSSDSVSFVAVGSQLADENVLALADANSGETGDSTYDFTPFYKEVKSFIQQSDLRLITQEGPVVGGTGSYEVSGSTNIIAPSACVDAIANTGFNLVDVATDHSYDAGNDGITSGLALWEQHPEIVIGGSYASQTDRETVHMIECNGMRFAFLSYTFGDASYSDVSKEPNNYSSVPFVQDDAEQDIARAKQVADCVIVSMHWGDENASDLNDNQRTWAQWFADEGVGLVVGTHSHTIQPVQYFTSSSGNKVPVVFGLGDFITGSTTIDSLLSGIFSCNFVRGSDGTVTAENLEWHPSTMWSDDSGDTYVRLLENLSVDQINANTRVTDTTDIFTQMYTKTNSTITQISVDWGSDADTKASTASGSSSASSSSSSSTTTTDTTTTTTDTSTDSDTSSYVDEDGDGYDDNTGEYFGGYDTSDDSDSSGYTDEDGDGYDDNTGEYFGGSDDTSDESDYSDYSDDEDSYY